MIQRGLKGVGNGWIRKCPGCLLFWEAVFGYQQLDAPRRTIDRDSYNDTCVPALSFRINSLFVRLLGNALARYICCVGC